MKSRSVIWWALLLALFPGIVSCTEVSEMASGQRLPNYETARVVFWKELYPNGGTTIYCRKLFGPGYNRGINIEHIFPASWIAYDLRCGKRFQCRENSDEFNRMEADLHNLYPARSDVNEARNNYRFAEIPGEQHVFEGCDFEFDEHQRIAEPAPAARGRIARSMLYMADEYGLYLKRRQRLLLEEWDRAYPPLENEYRRNDQIAKIQGNRNPYIDAHR